MSALNGDGAIIADAVRPDTWLRFEGIDGPVRIASVRFEASDETRAEFGLDIDGDDNPLPITVGRNEVMHRVPSSEVREADAARCFDRMLGTDHERRGHD
jgi:hypothetical protein